MNLSRRAFIGGAAVFGAYTYSRAFAAPEGLFSGAGAALILGVVSDIHVAEGRGDFRKFGDAVNLKRRFDGLMSKAWMALWLRGTWLIME